MQAFLIDPVAREVTAVEYDGDWQNISKLIGARVFDVARLQNGDSIFVDDEGLFREEQSFFMHTGYGNPLAGKGLVLGCDEHGDSTAPNCTLEELRAQVQFGFPTNVMGRLIWVRTMDL